jgi:hypothetical protein
VPGRKKPPAYFVPRVWFGVYASILAVVLVAFLARNSHGATPSGYGTATIDGVVKPGEWDAARQFTVTVAAPDKSSFSARVYVMNDASNLYAAAAMPTSSLQGLSYTAFGITLDSDHSGTINAGDDLAYVQAGPAVGPTAAAADSFWDSPSTYVLDTEHGGSSDIRRAVASDASTTYFELSHPLDTADDAHDASLKKGDVIGSFVAFVLQPSSQESPAITAWPQLGYSSDANFTVAAPQSPSTTGGAAVESGLRAVAHVVWKVSVPSGFIEISGRSSASASLSIALLPASSTTPIAAEKRAVARGAFTTSLRVPKTILPGVFTVSVAAVGAKTPTVVAVRISRPSEGIVSQALVSTSRGGPPILALAQDVKELWVEFRFSVPPTGSSVTIYWTTPAGTRVASVVKPVSTSVVSDVGSSASLPKGIWHATLVADGKIIRRATVRLR